MVSMASGGTAERITLRIFCKVLRPGSGTPARYSSTFFGAALPFVRELFFFFTGSLRLLISIHTETRWLNQNPRQMNIPTQGKLGWATLQGIYTR